MKMIGKSLIMGVKPDEKGNIVVDSGKLNP
jgi:hypothetical protein